MIALDIRVIAATHRNLEEMSANGDFREDLFYRLNVFPIEIPPLRQRKVDLPELVDHFIEKKSKELKLKAVPTIAPGTINQLIAYDWPGNVRELENLVERALIRYRSGELSQDDFITPKLQSPFKPSPAMNEEILPFDDMARQHILRAIKQTDGQISGANGAAALLRLQRGTLRGKMKKLGIG
ncbi:MAG: sigma-54-dependent Fis family transcriptional regulator [Deltaproteobacteria bacterium]|nr:sigma-54-dependent Fis family transcriptional regulator [Deltaproteobacteria bacterium]